MLGPFECSFENICRDNFGLELEIGKNATSW